MRLLEDYQVSERKEVGETFLESKLILNVFLILLKQNHIMQLLGRYVWAGNVFRNGFPAEVWPHGAGIQSTKQGGMDGKASAPRAAPAPGQAAGAGKGTAAGHRSSAKGRKTDCADQEGCFCAWAEVAGMSLGESTERQSMLESWHCLVEPVRWERDTPGIWRARRRWS